MIRDVTPDDAAAICGIYNHYIETSAAPFEEKVLSVETMRERIVATTQTHPWLVLERDGVAVGYAYARPWHVRSAFRFTAETSVYLSPDAMGHGLGRLLYQALLAEIEARVRTQCHDRGCRVRNTAAQQHGHDALVIEEKIALAERKWQYVVQLKSLDP